MTQLTVRVRAPFPDVVAATRECLAEQGFGVLTEIDVTATLRDKLGADLEDYLILGACNPPLAHRALAAERQIGVFLPCNVVVRAVPGAADDGPGEVVVAAVDPLGMVALAPDAADALRSVAEEAERRLATAVAGIGARLPAVGPSPA